MKFTRHSRLSANASPDLQIDREFSSAVQLSCRVVFRKPASSLSFPVLRNHPPRGGKVFLAALKAVEQCYRMQMRLDSVLQAVPPKSKGSGGISERRILAFRHSPPPFGPPLTSLPALLGSISCHREMRF